VDFRCLKSAAFLQPYEKPQTLRPAQGLLYKTGPRCACVSLRHGLLTVPHNLRPKLSPGGHPRLDVPCKTDNVRSTRWLLSTVAHDRRTFGELRRSLASPYLR